MIAKLKCRRGVSVLLAIVVLLVCSLAAAAALTAAVSNVGRYTHMRQDQQRYLAVSSAVRLVRDELCGADLSAKISGYMVRDPASGDIVPEVDPATGVVNYTQSVTCSNTAFRPWMEDAFTVTADMLDGGGLPAPSLDVSDLHFDVSATDKGLLDKVVWELKMEDDYSLVAHFWLDDNGTKYYPTVLTIPAEKSGDWTDEMQKDTSVARERWIITRTTQIRWSEKDADIRQE